MLLAVWNFDQSASGDMRFWLCPETTCQNAESFQFSFYNEIRCECDDWYNVCSTIRFIFDINMLLLGTVVTFPVPWPVGKKPSQRHDVRPKLSSQLLKWHLVLVTVAVVSFVWSTNSNSSFRCLFFILVVLLLGRVVFIVWKVFIFYNYPRFDILRFTESLKL